MKYLLITKSSYSFNKYEIEEFDSAEELAQKVMRTGLGEDAIIAQRVGLQVQVCDWTQAQPKEEPLQEAA